MQITNFRHTSLGKIPVLQDFLLLKVDQDTLEHVPHVLHIDGEGDNVRPAPAFRVTQRLVAYLGQVELYGRVEIVHDVIHCTQALAQRKIIGLQHGEHALEHCLYDVSQTQRLPGGAGDGK